MPEGSAIYGILYFLFMCAVILAAAYFVTRYISRKSFNRGMNKNLKIVETAALGIDKSLLLVKVGEQYLLLGSTQKNITLLSEIDPENLTLRNTAEVNNNIDGESFEAYMNKLQDENSNAGMNSIKDNLKKLKSIVRGNRTDV
jgi:flagellar protein FliO/FliZ